MVDMSSPTSYKVSIVKAIQTLDNLNDQIIRFIFNPHESLASVAFPSLPSCQHQQQLKSSMIVMRRLLLDAQSRFRRMVEENKALATRIDGTITYAAHEVDDLRMELDEANKKLDEFQNKSSGSDTADSGIDEIQSVITIRDSVGQLQTELVRLRQENGLLVEQVEALTRQVEQQIVHEQAPADLSMELLHCRQELGLAKDALLAMREERKKLKAEKIELLNQIKQLYVTLEDKEAEFRDFIRNYEYRTRESDDSFKQMAAHNEESEQAKWALIKHAKDAAETAVLLKAQLDERERDVQRLEDDVSELKDQLSQRRIKRYIPDVLSPGSITVQTTSSEELPPYETPPTSAKYSSRDNTFDSRDTPLILNGDSIPNMFHFLHTSTPDITPNANNNNNGSTGQLGIGQLGTDHKKKKRRSFGSFSRVFTKTRSRRSVAIPIDIDVEETEGCNVRISLLSAHNYQEKLNIVESSRSVPIPHWRANQVLAWLEIVLCMPMYGKRCSENIKSGKVLLELSDSELNSALGITNVIHRRKLRLAIDEHRDPSSTEYERASSLDHTWVAHRWLADIGLPQYMSAFETQLVDGRVLNTLSKRDLEKHLSVHRKFHQTSILHATELLRRVEFNKELLNERRAACDQRDIDPLVWTNQRVMKWVNSIDLGEYSDSLRETGINGALMVLEPSFTADILSSSLHIPTSKACVKKHLSTELDSLLSHARSELDSLSSDTKKLTSFQRSQKSGRRVDEPGRRHSFKGSIGRAFGRKVRDDLKLTESDTPCSKPRPVISAPISTPIHTKSFSLSPVSAGITTV